MCSSEGEACSTNADCQGGLLCDSCQNICRIPNYPTIARPGGGPPGPQWEFCSNWCCQEGEGDCDDDAECEGNLICAHQMCPNVIYVTSDDIDCCGLGPNSTSTPTTQ